MLPKDNYYIGFLTNVDSSILKVKLEYGFTIHGMKISEYDDYVDGFIDDEIFYQLYWPYFIKVKSHEMSILNKDEGKLYFVKNSYDKYQEHIEYPYMIERLLRLFKEGNIWISMGFTSEKKKENWMKTPFSCTSNLSPISSLPKYALTDSDVQKVNTFLKTFEIPFKNPYLELAFDNFELSYKVKNRNLSFLTLMIGFEALFNRGGTELTQTVSRHTGILLGNERSDFERIYNDMRKFYKTRSHIVHAVDPKKRKPLDQEDVIKLRNYLRECIRKIYLLGCEKKELYELLNSRGF